MINLTIEQVKNNYLNGGYPVGMVGLIQAREESEICGYNMFKMSGKWVWFKK